MNPIFPFVYLASLLLFIPSSSWSFLSQSAIHRNNNKIIHQHKTTTLQESSSSSIENLPTSSLEIVLFGIGDLRTTDHGGLSKALISSSSSPSTKILPLFLLDPKDTLSNMPMGRTHLIDNASILHSSLISLQRNLKSKFDLDLHVCSGKDGQGVVDCLEEVIHSVVAEGGTSLASQLDKIVVHSCDLGDVDNEKLAYGPYGHLMKHKNDNDYHDIIVDGVGVEIQVQGWDCFLRQGPWNDLSSNVDGFPSLFTEYENKYSAKTRSESSVSDTFSIPSEKNNASQKVVVSAMTNVPSVKDVSELMCTALDIVDCDDLEYEVNTGLFATHWGGLDISSTMNEKCILKAIDIYLGKDASSHGMDGDEALAETLKWWSNTRECKLKRNPKSLEHASINRLMTGGDKSSASTGGVKTKNLIEGELLTRYLAAPLLFGTVSTRYLWRQSEEVRKKNQSPFEIFSPNTATQTVKSIAENREWHKLFASKNVKMNCSQQSNAMSYDYFRWHGYLCRYGTSAVNLSTKDDAKEGVVLIHGFGASGSQWDKAMMELQKSLGGDRKVEGLAPDLIGFGQSEKPSLTYTQYMWEGYAADCVKEIGLGKRGWTSFMIGGNSIGGYTAMGTAADDTNISESSETVSAIGSAGSGRCKGLMLMNSAGRILSSAEVNESDVSIAESTALDLLGTTSPPPRGLAKFGGNGLLAYLRPQIKSICKNLYPTNPEAVDDTLCDGILRDSLDPGAINVMISGSKLPPPRTANELLGADYGSSKTKETSRVKEKIFNGPVLVAQGILDPLNDASGRADMLSKLRSGITVNRMDGGHCPHDELPGVTADYISSWIKTSVWNE